MTEDFTLTYATRALELLGKIAQVDLDFRLEKIDAKTAWKKTHEILKKDKEKNDLN